MDQQIDNPRYYPYVFVALVALVIGILLGIAGRDSHTGSRIEWPEPTHAKSTFPP